MRKEDGAILCDGQQVGTTRQCAHCGCHCLCVPGSGVQRGICLKCQKFVCGKPACMTACIPHEAWLEHMAGRRTKYTELIQERERTAVTV